MSKTDLGNVGRRWWRWAGCLLLPMHMAGAAPDPAPAAIDQEWRDRFVMGYFADARRNQPEAEKSALAAMAAAKAGGDARARLRAASRYFMAMSANANAYGCSVIDEYLALAKASKKDYAGELFDIAAAIGDRPCSTKVSIEELEALARQLGDPARTYFLLEAKVSAAERANQFNEAMQLRAQQLDHTIADFQIANAMAGLALAEYYAKSESNKARDWLVKGLATPHVSDYPALHALLLSILFRVEASAGNLDAAFAAMKSVDPLLRANVLPASSVALMSVEFSRALIKTNKPQEALAVLDDDKRFKGSSRTVSAMRSSALLEAFSKLGTADAHRRGLKEIQALDLLFADPEYATPRRVAANRKYVADFHEAFGDYQPALMALKAANKADEEVQKRANETARVELREKLDVAAKDKENTQLKADAELQAARQRGWIVAFVAAAVGVAAAGAALAVAVRRGRRLAKVSAELEQRNGELEQRSASRIRLLAAACHDLRQPAHALVMLAELGADAQREPSRFVAWLQSVRRSTASLGEMLDELMDLGRLDGGHYQPQLSDVSLAELQHDVMLHFGGLAKRKGLTLEVPPADGHVVSDRHLLRRIVFNLVSNAIKYSDTGFVRVSVQAWGDHHVQLAVQDSGPGIPPDKLDDVFRDYVRLNPTKAAEGLGIGLSIVRRASELLGHELKLASPPGEGTTVTLRMQLAATQPLAAPAPTASDTTGTAHGVLALLEDDVDVRDAMAALLQRWGYTVLAGADAQAVLAQLDDPHKPDLVITDLHMGSSNGLAEVAHLREALQASDLPALLVTGDLDAAIATQAAQAQVFVAHKPLAPRKLSALVGQLLSAPAASQPQAAAPIT